MKRLYRYTVASSALGAALSSYLYYAPAYHKKNQVLDANVVRWARTGGGVKHNPGVRVLPLDSLKQQGNTERAVETCKTLAKRHAVSHITPAQSFAFALQMIEAGNKGWRGEINMLRMTGRRERADQVVCPWLYADAFDLGKVPSAFSPIMQELSAAVSTSHIRDITINYRHDGYYRLDPHVDPIDDGSKVCIVSLSAGAVLTLAPQRLNHFCKFINKVLPNALHVKTVPYSIDVHVPKGHALILEGPARYTWTHAIRQGFYKKSQSKIEEDNVTLWDTFGGTTEIERSPQRWSLVFAFQ